MASREVGRCAAASQPLPAARDAAPFGDGSEWSLKEAVRWSPGSRRRRPADRPPRAERHVRTPICSQATLRRSGEQPELGDIIHDHHRARPAASSVRGDVEPPIPLARPAGASARWRVAQPPPSRSFRASWAASCAPRAARWPPSRPARPQHPVTRAGCSPQGGLRTRTQRCEREGGQLTSLHPCVDTILTDDGAEGQPPARLKPTHSPLPPPRVPPRRRQ